MKARADGMQPSAGMPALRGGVQGASYGFADEASAGLNAAFDRVTGRTGDLGERYEQYRDYGRQKDREAEEANPGAYLAGQVAGGIGSAVAAPAIGAGVKGSAATGAAYSGLAGFGAGEGFGDRALGALGAGALGAGVGAAVPRAMDAVAAGAHLLGEGGRVAAGAVRAAVNPEAEALRRVQGAVARDASAGQAVDDATLLAAREAGQPVAVVDVGGEATRTLARGAASRSAEGRETLQRFVEPRFEAQGARVTDFVRTLVGSANAGATGASADAAMEAGGRFVQSSAPNVEVRRTVARMAEPERARFAEGFASSLIDAVSRVPDRSSVVGRIFGTPAARERVAIALGKDRAAELEAFLHRETIMDLARTALENPAAARVLMEGGTFALGSGYSLLSGDPRGFMTGLLVAGLSKGARAIDGRVARKVADMLVSDDPATIRKATAMIGRNPTLREALRSAESYIVKAVAVPAAEGGRD